MIAFHRILCVGWAVGMALLNVLYSMVEGIRNLHVRFPEGTNERHGRWKKGFAGKGGRDESCSATKTGRPPMRGIHCTVTVSKGTCPADRRFGNREIVDHRIIEGRISVLCIWVLGVFLSRSAWYVH